MDSREAQSFLGTHQHYQTSVRTFMAERIGIESSISARCASDLPVVRSSSSIGAQKLRELVSLRAISTPRVPASFLGAILANSPRAECEPRADDGTARFVTGIPDGSPRRCCSRTICRCRSARPRAHDTLSNMVPIAPSCDRCGWMRVGEGRVHHYGTGLRGRAC